jgi:hypothetical protein
MVWILYFISSMVVSPKEGWVGGTCAELNRNKFMVCGIYWGDRADGYGPHDDDSRAQVPAG